MGGGAVDTAEGGAGGSSSGRYTPSGCQAVRLDWTWWQQQRQEAAAGRAAAPGMSGPAPSHTHTRHPGWDGPLALQLPS